jgi:hypothetical protein
VVYDRLWSNQWSSGAGDALQSADITAAITLPGAPPGPEEGFSYYTGIDLAISRDHSSVVTIGKHHTGRVKLVDVRDWAPDPNEGPVEVAAVEEVCLLLSRTFRPKFLADPYQSQYLCQRLRERGCVVEMVPFVGKALVEMASGLVELFSGRKIDLYDDALLVGDLRRLRIRESPSGWRLDAPRTAAGHCDRATALALAVWGARKGYVSPPFDPDTSGPVVLTKAHCDPSTEMFGWDEPAPFLHGRSRTAATGGGPPKVIHPRDIGPYGPW